MLGYFCPFPFLLQNPVDILDMKNKKEKQKNKSKGGSLVRHTIVKQTLKCLIITACMGALLYVPLCAGGMTEAVSSAGAKEKEAGAAVNDFELEQPEATPEPTYKPIKGVRITAPNDMAKKSRESIEKKIKKKEEEIRATKDEIREGKQRRNAYREVQSELSVDGDQGIFRYGSLFIDNGRGNSLLSKLSFDHSLAGIRDYGRIADNRNVFDTYMSMTHMSVAHMSVADSCMEGGHSVISVFRPEFPAGGIVDIAPYLQGKIDAEKDFITEKKKDLKALKGVLAALKKSRPDVDDIVFNSRDITEISHITVPQMKELLSGTELEQFAGVYVEIEKEYGINAIAFCALSALESAWGTSRRARCDHNYTGFGVYSDDAPGINADSGEENLKMTAGHLAKEYLHKGDRYYNGRGLDGINRSYAASRTWAYGIEDIGIRLMSKLHQ